VKETIIFLYQMTYISLVQIKNVLGWNKGFNKICYSTKKSKK